MNRPLINFIEKNIHGAWIISGQLGFRQYYGYTKAEAIAKYKAECDQKLLINQRRMKNA